MESSGTTPPGGQSPAAVPDIAAAFDGTPPFVTVYLATEAAVEQAAQQSELRWKTLRRRPATPAGSPRCPVSGR